MVVLYKLYRTWYTYSQWLEQYWRRKNKARLHIPQISTVNARSVHSLHFSQSFVPLHCSAECSAAACQAATFKFNRPQAGRPSKDEVTHWHLNSVALRVTDRPRRTLQWKADYWELLTSTQWLTARRHSALRVKPRPWWLVIEALPLAHTREKNIMYHVHVCGEKYPL